MAVTNYCRMENTRGGSHKFYEVFIENEGGWVFHMRWGAIGTEGRQKTKDFGSRREALVALNAKLKEKLGHGGYVSVEGDSFYDENLPPSTRQSRSNHRQTRRRDRKRPEAAKAKGTLPETRTGKRRNIIRD